jgi:hypothetical protein
MASPGLFDIVNSWADEEGEGSRGDQRGDYWEQVGVVRGCCTFGHPATDVDDPDR